MSIRQLAIAWFEQNVPELHLRKHFLRHQVTYTEEQLGPLVRFYDGHAESSTKRYRLHVRLLRLKPFVGDIPWHLVPPDPIRQFLNARNLWSVDGKRHTLITQEDRDETIPLLLTFFTAVYGYAKMDKPADRAWNLLALQALEPLPAAGKKNRKRSLTDEEYNRAVAALPRLEHALGGGYEGKVATFYFGTELRDGKRHVNYEVYTWSGLTISRTATLQPTPGAPRKTRSDLHASPEETQLLAEIRETTRFPQDEHWVLADPQEMKAGRHERLTQSTRLQWYNTLRKLARIPRDAAFDANGIRSYLENRDETNAVALEATRRRMNHSIQSTMAEQNYSDPKTAKQAVDAITKVYGERNLIVCECGTFAAPYDRICRWEKCRKPLPWTAHDAQTPLELYADFADRALGGAN